MVLPRSRLDGLLDKALFVAVLFAVSLGIMLVVWVVRGLIGSGCRG